MSSTEPVAWLAALLLATALPACASGGARAGGAGTPGVDVCSMRAGDPLQQIHLFDGPPADLAYLAPDGPGRAASTYTLKAIHAGGGSVTVRCIYRSGEAVEVVLARTVSLCTHRAAPGNGGQLRCR